MIVGCLIHLLMVRCKIQLAVIMAVTHNADTTQGDLIKLIRILVYLEGTPDLGSTFYTTGGAILHAKTGGSQFSVSFSIGETSAPFHTISQVQSMKISLVPSHGEFHCYYICVEYIKYYRHFMDWIGFPQESFTVTRTDFTPAIRMATSSISSTSSPRTSMPTSIPSRLLIPAKDSRSTTFHKYL